MTTREQEVLEADDQRIRALIDKDSRALKSLHADDLVYVHSTAAVDDRRSYLEALDDGSKRFLKIRREGAQVRIWGTVAMLDATVHVDVQFGDQRRRATSRVISVWVHRDNRWQLAHYQATAVATSPG